MWFFFVLHHLNSYSVSDLLLLSSIFVVSIHIRHLVFFFWFKLFRESLETTETKNNHNKWEIITTRTNIQISWCFKKTIFHAITKMMEEYRQFLQCYLTDPIEENKTIWINVLDRKIVISRTLLEKIDSVYFCSSKKLLFRTLLFWAILILNAFGGCSFFYLVWYSTSKWKGCYLFCSWLRYSEQEFHVRNRKKWSNSDVCFVYCSILFFV